MSCIARKKPVPAIINKSLAWFVNVLLLSVLTPLFIQFFIQQSFAQSFAQTFAQTSVTQYSVRDDAGQLIQLQQPVRRIVSLAPHATELLFAAGAGDKVVGVVNFSDYPAAAKKIQLVGSHENVDLERIIALQPDLVVAWKTGNSQDALKKIKSMGIKVYISEPRKFEDIADNIDRLGILSGTQEQANKASLAFRNEHKRLRQLYANKKTVRVFYQVWNQPLMTINGKHLISDVIKLCGGENIFAGLATLAPKLDIEAVLQADPDVFVVGGMANDRSDWIEAWYKWPYLKAVKQGNLFFIPPDIILRHTPRVLLGARQLCERLEEVRRKNN